MSIDTGSLRKALDLERKLGYTDSAIIGGLDKFLQRLKKETDCSFNNLELNVPSVIPDLIRPTYISLNKEQRARRVENILEFLDRLDKTHKDKHKTRLFGKGSKKGRVAEDLSNISLEMPITTLKGISSSMASRFKKMGVETIRDLLYFFPHRHLDYSQRKHISSLCEGEEETIVANVWQAYETRLGTRRSTEAVVGDETGNVRVVWFNNPYLAKKLTPNTRIAISGRVRLFNGRYVFESPEWEELGGTDLIHTGRLVPIYHLTSGLHPRQVRKIIKNTVDSWSTILEDFLPPEIRQRQNLFDLPRAIAQAHYPDNAESKDRARRRLAFDELFLLQLGVLRKKHEWQESQPAKALHIDSSALESFLKSLPFQLTNAQQKVLGEIKADMARTRPMSRLLQGEVGSGKTIVATAALLIAVKNGFQTALMAPTEILAEQHLATIRKLFSQAGTEHKEGHLYYSYTGLFNKPVTIAILTGDMNAKNKNNIKRLIAAGEVDIVIGTHALIQKDISFLRLGLAVIDEQHRFGVTQRSTLRQKGFNPHILVMTATPIPRTLALTLYGDLDLSVIDQLPPGRQVIKTKWLSPGQRDSAYGFLRRQIREGHQAFILCPLVEESEAVQAKAAINEYEHLCHNVFPDLKLGLIHGRMSSMDKDNIMRRFRSAELDILVSTPVIEVGIDVPNATVMMVESADRFGLSQLHQFRGRVGRGDNQSYCILLAQNPSKVSQERLGIIEETNNGFMLAERDLELRGPGEFFGTRQSGLPDLKMAKLSDITLLEAARREAIRLFKADPVLERSEHQMLVRELSRVWPDGGGEQN